MTEPSEDLVPTCVDHDHYPLVMINDFYNFSADKMFNFVFDDSSVQKALSQKRHRSDVVWNPWKLEADGTKQRDVTYIVTLKRQPKPFDFTEKQVLFPESKPGSFYLLEGECSSLSVPYGDSFTVVDRCYIDQIADDKCQLCITCDIKFQKKVWGPVKNVITDMATDGITKYFHLLAELLHREESGYEHSDSETSGMPVEQPEYNAAEEEYFEDRSFFSTGIIYFLFSCSIFCLVCIIGVLFYGLWASVDRITSKSYRELDKQRMSRAYNRHPVETIADDLVAQLSELLASATRLIEATAENLEELTGKEPKIQNGQEEGHLQQQEKEQEQQQKQEQI